MLEPVLVAAGAGAILEIGGVRACSAEAATNSACAARTRLAVVLHSRGHKAEMDGARRKGPLARAGACGIIPRWRHHSHDCMNSAPKTALSLTRNDAIVREDADVAWAASFAA
jgi:hypothetical protein